MNKNIPTLISQDLTFTYALSFNISEFDCDRDVDICDILDTKAIHQEMQDKYVKMDVNGSYLKPLFFMDELRKEDFQEFNGRNELKQYLYKISSDEKWANFNEIFRDSVDKFFNNDMTNCVRNIFVLNKDDFTEMTEKVREREFYSYGFYLLLIWICHSKGRFYICEWKDE